MPTTDLSITCPVCGMTSYNLNDVANGYCGNCHAYTGVVNPLAKAKQVLQDAGAEPVSRDCNFTWRDDETHTHRCVWGAAHGQPCRCECGEEA